MNGGTHNRGAGCIENHCAVHFRQLAQAGCGERHVEGEAAVGNALDRAVESENDQCTGAATQDPLEAIVEFGARRDPREDLLQARIEGCLGWGHILTLIVSESSEPH